LDAISYLHRNRIWHGDIKPENVRVTSLSIENGPLVLADFGLAVKSQESQQNDEFIGSLAYMSPKLIIGDLYNEKVDIWALGIVMSAALTGSFPFETEDPTLMQLEMISGLADLLEGPKLESVSDEAKDLLRKLLEEEPKNRVSAEQALNHPWFEGIRK
jgi:serine/threonine protein kinase